jgi:alpha/beta superfamily hydrolase
MYRIKIPSLDIYGSDDWTVTMWGADERKRQLVAVPGSGQIMVQGAKHFFENREQELVRTIVAFLDRSFQGKP